MIPFMGVSYRDTFAPLALVDAEGGTRRRDCRFHDRLQIFPFALQRMRQAFPGRLELALPRSRFSCG
jgi:hypothetical protein